MVCFTHVVVNSLHNGDNNNSNNNKTKQQDAYTQKKKP